MSVRKELEKLGLEALIGETVSFKPVTTEKDVIYVGYDCQLEPGQWDLVNPPWFTFGRAYLAPEDHFPCVILNEEGTYIGFIDLCKWICEGEAYTWSCFIDKNHQGKGYGKAVVAHAIRIFCQAKAHCDIKVAVEAANARAQHLYETMGLTRLEEMDGDDLVYGLLAT